MSDLRDKLGSEEGLLIALALTVGAGAGVGAIGFRYLIEGFTWLFTGHTDPSALGHFTNPHLAFLGPFVVLVVPVVGGLLYGPLVYRFAPEARGHGVPEVMLAVHQNEGKIRGRVPVVKSLASAVTIGAGGGTLAPDGSEGTLETSGGIEITKKTETLSPSVKLKNIAVDFGTKAATVELEILPAPPFPGATGRASIADLTLPTGSVIANPGTRQIAVTGAEAKLQAVAASTLNSVFNQPAPEPPPSSNFVVGDPFGTFSLVAQAE